MGVCVAGVCPMCPRPVSSEVLTWVACRDVGPCDTFRRRSREPTQEARHSISKVVMSKAKVIESSHPLILHKITQMRKVRSPMAVCEPRSTPSAVTQRIKPANSAL